MINISPYRITPSLMSGNTESGSPKRQEESIALGSKIYVGEWLNGLRHGQGKQRWTNGTLYEGGWVKGKMSGFGVCNYPDGDRYEGEWENGVRSGKGTLIFSDGSRYDGEWQFGKRHGQGCMVEPNGDRYSGGWQNNEKHGTGTCTCSKGKQYTGVWKEGEKWGDGCQLSPDTPPISGKFYGNGILIRECPKIAGSLIRLPSTPHFKLMAVQFPFDPQKAFSTPKEMEWVKMHSDLFIMPLSMEDLRRRTSMHKARVVWIRAHGHKNFMQMTNDERIEAEALIDWLKTCTYKKSLIILDSCTTGTIEGIAQRVSSQLKKAYVISPFTKVRFIDPKVNEHIIQCQMYDGDFRNVTYTYRKGKPWPRNSIRLGPPSIDQEIGVSS